MIDGLTLSISANAVPKWSGTLVAAIIADNTKIVRTSVPIAKVEGGYEYVSLDLWIESLTIKNEEELNASGIPYVAQVLNKHHDPTIITPSSEILDDYIETSTDESLDTYRELYAETLEQVLAEFLSGTGWSIKLDSSLIGEYPVVTESNPVVVLNGSLIAQLTELLGIFTPTNLWGQSLSFFVNIFTLEIIITTPTGGILEPHSVSMADIRPTDLDVTVEDTELPVSIVLQEQGTSLFRSPYHLVNGMYKSEDYKYETQTMVEEGDGGTTQINATASGTRVSIGNLTLTDVSNVVIDQSETSEISYCYRYGYNCNNITQNWSKDKTTDITVETEYEYMIGPPYDVDRAFNVLAVSTNSCFTKSYGGTRQQISRDYGSVKITKDSYPERLLTTDGIRVMKKKVITTETTKNSIDPMTGAEFPPFIDTEEKTTTTVTEVFGYDDDGILVMDRKETEVVPPNGQLTLTEETKIITKVSDALFAETVYTLQTKYDQEGVVMSATVTNVNVSMVSGQPSGPSPMSAYVAVEESDLLREEVFNKFSERVINGVDTNGNPFTLTDSAIGTVYCGVENLTLEEMKEYLSAHYNTSPNRTYYVSFNSNFVDVRGIIGGRLQLTVPEGSLNNSSLYSFDSDLSKSDIIGSNIIATMEEEAFRVTGISMNWDKEDVPTVALALCQMI